MKNKNTYESADVTDSGASKHMSGLHNRCVRTNQYIWDMMKVLDKKEMYGFHFQTKVGAKKIMVILHHDEKGELEKAQKILKNVAKSDDVLFLIKLKEQKEKSKIGITLFILTFSLVLLTLLVSFLYKNGYLDLMIETLQPKKAIEQVNIEKDFSIGEKEPNVEEIVVDIEKLKLLKESFEEQNNTALDPKVMQALTMTTGIISDEVSEEEKAKYSAEALTKSFKGKAGFKLVVKDNNQSKDFNSTVKELNSYAMNFVQENNLSEALKYYDKVSKEENLTKKEEMINAYHQAEIFEEMGLNEEAKGFYNNAVKLSKALKDNNSSMQEEMLSSFYQTEMFDKMGVNEGNESVVNALKLREALKEKGQTANVLNELVSLGQLAQLHEDLNETKKAEEITKKAQSLYEQLIVELKKYGEVKSEELALALNYLANFYTDNNEYRLSIEIQKEALKIYEELLQKEHDKFALTYYKTLNSLGGNYLKINKFKLAEQTYEKALALMEKFIKLKVVNNREYIALSYRTLAMVAIKHKKLEKAKKYYLDALNIYVNLEKKEKLYQFQITDMHREFAVLYTLEEKFKLAGEEYHKGISKFIVMNKKIPLKYNLEIAKLLNDSAFMKMSNYDMNSTEVLQAKIELRESTKWGSKVIEINFKEAKESIAKSYAYLAYIAGTNNDMELALEYYKISYALKRVKGIKAFKLLKLSFY